MGQELFKSGPTGDALPDALPNRFKLLPVAGVRDGAPFVDFVKMDAKGLPPVPTPDYHPTCIYVACTQCKTIGNIMFPRGFSYKTGDALMDGKIVKAMCYTCRGVMEMRPLTPADLKDNQLALLRRHYEILKAWAIQTGTVHPTEKAFTDVYEAKYGINGDPEKIEAERRRRASLAEAPSGSPRIIVP